MTKKMMLKLCFLAATFVAALVGCSSDSSSSADNSGALNTNGNDKSVIVYSYDEFSEDDVVKILDDDTTTISIDQEFAGKADSVLPEKGAILVVWEKINSEPYYVKIVSVKEDSSRYTVEVKPATPFEAIPNGDYSLSSEVYINYDVKTNGGKYGANAFYNKETKTYHPFLITEEPNLLKDDGESIKGTVVTEGKLGKTLKEKHYVDLREPKLTSGSEDWTIIDINAEFHPGKIAIPGLGKTVGEYQGGWLDALGGMEKLDKAFDKNGGKNPDGSPLKAYVRMDTLQYKSKVNFHISWVTDWGIKAFEFYATGTEDVYMSDFGLGLGAGFSGDKKITSFEGKGFFFSIYGVPIYIKIVPNLYLKYNLEAYALLDYRLQYKRHAEARAGIGWKSGNGVYVINEGSTTTKYNESHSFKDFVNKSEMVFCGKASAGVYLRVAALLYNVVGPTAGLGFRVDLNAEVGTSTSYDDEGNWTGNVELDSKSYVELGGALAVEAGAEVTLLGHQLFSKAYDVYDIKKFSFFRFPQDDVNLSSRGGEFSSSSRGSVIPEKDGPLSSSSSEKQSPLSSSRGISLSSSSHSSIIPEKDGPLSSSSK